METKLKNENNTNTLFRREIAFLIDITVVSVSLGIIMAIVVRFWEPNFVMAAIHGAVHAAAMLCKDLLRPSIGKRIMKMDIVSRDKSKPKAWKLIVRNLTMGLWFIELPVISSLKNKTETRLTDKLLGLEVVYH